MTINSHLNILNTCHSLKHSAQRSMTSYSQTLFKACFFIICSSFASYQTWRVFNLYLAYPTYTLMTVDRPKTIVLPAMTFCSPISVKKSVLEDASAMEDEFLAPPSRKLQEKIDKLYRNFLHSLHVEDIFHLAPKFGEFILQAKCLMDEIFNTSHCGNLKDYALKSLHELEACWTLFHRLTPNPLIDDVNLQLNQQTSETMVLINEQTVLAGPRDIEFEPGELIRFTIDLMMNESVSLHLPIGATLRVHDSDRIASRDSDVAVLITADLHYRIKVMEKKYVTLPAPYATNCRHYFEGNVKNVSAHDSDYMRSHFDCISSCLARETQKRCSCWPPEVAYVVLDQSTYGECIMCDWVEMGKKNKQPDDFSTNNTHDMLKANFDISRAARDVFNNCTGNHVDMCTQLCPLECVYSYYDMEYETNKWSDDDSFDYVNASHADDSALISLIRDDYVIQMQSVPIYDFLSTLSSAGGIFALWISFTFAAILHQIRTVVQFTRKSCRLIAGGE